MKLRRQSLLLAMLICMTVPPALSATESPHRQWRTEARNARKALKHQDYLAAIAGYEKAIELVSKTKTAQFHIYDLKLCLAETLRLAVRMDEARRILDEVEKALPEQKALDPMLETRYWRKRALLETTLGNKKEIARCDLNAFNHLVQSFSPRSAHVIGDLPLLMKRLALNDWASAVELLKKTHELYKDYPKILNMILRGYQSTFSEFEVVADAYSKAGQLEKTRIALSELSEVDGNYAGLIARWDRWLKRAQEAHQTSSDYDVAKGIATVLVRMGNSPDAQARTRGYLLLMELFERDPNIIVNLYNERPELFKEVLQELSRENTIQKSNNQLQESVGRLAGARFLKEKFDEITLQLFEAQVRLTEYPKSAAEAQKMDKTFATSHLGARQMLTLLRVRRVEPDEAASVLASFNPIAVSKVEVGTEYKARMNARIAHAYLKKGRMADGRRHLDEGWKLFKIVGPTCNKKSLKDILDGCEKLIIEAQQNWGKLPERKKVGKP